MKAWVVTIILFWMIGCADKDNGSSGILSMEKMQVVMWDIIGADVFTEQFIKRDSSKKASLENIQLQNKVFTLHKVTRADFYKSYDYYVSHAELMKVILDSMTAKAERERTKMMQRRYDSKAKQVK